MLLEVELLAQPASSRSVMPFEPEALMLEVVELAVLDVVLVELVEFAGWVLIVPATFAPPGSVTLVDVPLFTDVASLAVIPLPGIAAQDGALLLVVVLELALLLELPLQTELLLKCGLCMAVRKWAMAWLLMVGVLPVIT